MAPGLQTSADTSRPDDLGSAVLRWRLVCRLLLTLAAVTSALKCIRCKNCAAKYEDSQSVRCDADKDTCQVRALSSGQQTMPRSHTSEMYVVHCHAQPAIQSACCWRSNVIAMSKTSPLGADSGYVLLLTRILEHIEYRLFLCDLRTLGER